MFRNDKHQKNALPRSKGRRVIVIAILICLALLTMTSIALAQSGGDYTLLWWTVDNGSGIGAGGVYGLSSILGQPDAGAPMSGGQFGLQGGLGPPDEPGAGPPPGGDHPIYLPFIVLN